jgi:diguanylate cyclase (GGDEF)-like protein
MNSVLEKALSAPISAALVAGAITAGAAFQINQLENAAYLAQLRNRVVERVAALRSRLEQAINVHLSVLQTTEALVLANPAIDDPAFQRVAEALQRQLPAVAEIQLSPDAVIQFVYPPERAEKVRGLNLLTLPGQKNVIEQTIRDGKLRVAGPLPLYQGGIGIIARNPVYLGTADARKFWGFVTLVLDYEKFIAPFSELTGDPELEFAVRGKDSLGAAGELFLGDAATFSGQAITATVNLPNGEWQLAAQPRGGWPAARPNSLLFTVLSVLLALGVGALALAVRARGNAIQHMANTDALTGMLSRHALMRQAATETQRAQRYGRPLSFIMLDIDDFKKVNDTWGHACGDLVLVEVSKRVRALVRSSDMLGRIGGEEFAIVAPETNRAQAATLAEHIRAGIMNLVIEFNREHIARTVSCGVAELQAEGDKLETLMAAADKALYQAKSEGGNRVCIALRQGAS